MGNVLPCPGTPGPKTPSAWPLRLFRRQPGHAGDYAFDTGSARAHVRICTAVAALTNRKPSSLGRVYFFQAECQDGLHHQQ